MKVNSVFRELFGKRASLILSVVLAAMIALVPVAQAQDTGTVTGTVTDATGAAIPSALVVVKNLGTNAVRQAASNASGAYQVTGLAPAVYELTASAPGFTRFLSKIEITVGGKLSVDVKLTVGSTTTSVEVSTADAGVQVNTQTQELSQVINSTQITELPSLTRNPYDFVALSGNVSSGDSSGPGKSQNATT